MSNADELDYIEGSHVSAQLKNETRDDVEKYDIPPNTEQDPVDELQENDFEAKAGSCEAKFRDAAVAEPYHLEEDGGKSCGATSTKSEDYDDSQSESDENASDEEVQHESAEILFKMLAAQNRIAHRTINDEDLPPTVSVLNSHNGAKVYLIGTAHFSKESCDDVRKVISQAQPDIVMVELCRGRTDLLINDEETLAKLAGDVSFDKIVKQMKHKGIVSGIMTFLLLHMSAHITKQLGMAPGGEFRAAFQESRKVSGCKLLFGDRAVEVTLKRAFSKFTLWQKLKFVSCILRDLGPIKPEDIEKLKEKDMLEQALGEMMGEFPEMTSVFLTERDIYLAHSLQVAASTKIHTETETVPPVVVGVVGLGHAAGIKEHFYREITAVEMDELTEVPAPSKVRSVLKTAFKATLFASLLYGAYRFSAWTGLFRGLGNMLEWSDIGGWGKVQ